MRLVKVEWKDVVKQASWLEPGELADELASEKRATFVSVGYLYEKSDKWVVLLPSVSFDEDGNLAQVCYELIPRGMITRIITLKE